MTRSLVLAAVGLGVLTGLSIGGCTTTDGLYTFCTTDAQCGSRTYQMGEDEVTVQLVCLEVSVEVSLERTTLGSFCTRTCFSNADCDSRIGLGDGVCIQWEGDDRGHCYQPCTSADECYPSSACESVLLDGVATPVCLPERS